jgi:pimeloyl-ACP methyl ester carboxylesterase
MQNTVNFIASKKHDRTIMSASTYFLTKIAFHLAPDKVTRFIREKGFAIKPLQLSAGQRELHKQAYKFYLEFNNNKIKVFEWGTGPVIILVHGWGGRALQLDAFVASLVSRGFKVVAFDQKGHGESSSSFSSYPEFVRSTELVAAHYANSLYGVIAHSIGANSMFKVSELFNRKLKLAVVAPVENFLGVLEILRMKMGVYEKLFAQIIRQIETENNLYLSELTVFDYERINKHDVLLVHDKFDKVNNINASYEIHQNLKDSTLMQTEKLGHSRILRNQEVVDRVVSHFNQPYSLLDH